MNAITIGSAVCDIFLSGKTLTQSTALCPNEGCKIPIENIALHSGGGAINSSIILCKLNIESYPVSIVGNDSFFTTTIQKTLSKNNINQKYIKISNKSQTALSILLPQKNNQTTILTYKGAGSLLDIEEMQNPLQHPWDIAYIAPISGPLNQKLFILIQQIKKRNPKCIIAHNPNPYQLKKTIQEQHKILPLLDLYILNKEEAKIAWETEHNTPFTIDYYLKELSQIGPKCLIVVTQGPRGLDWKKGKKHGHIQAKAIKPLHSVGAGDSCGAAITAALAQGKSPEEALELGMQIAEKVLTSTGVEALKTPLCFKKRNKQN